MRRYALESVVARGTGHNAYIGGYRVGGKTGTAQKYENNSIAEGKYIASFIGFAPYDNPEYLVYVLVDEPKGAYYGGVVAKPIGQKIFSSIFNIKSIQPNVIGNSMVTLYLDPF